MHEVDKTQGAGKTQGSGKTQDGRQDARCGQPAKRMGRKKREAKRTQDGKQQVRQDAGPTIRCTRARKRLPHAPGYCIIHLSGRLRRRIVALSRRPIKPKSNHNKKENIEYESSSHCHRQRYRRHPCQHCAGVRAKKRERFGSYTVHFLVLLARCQLPLSVLR